MNPQISPNTQKSGRIEYIDAMRGLTMLLVVYAHVSLYVVSGHRLVAAPLGGWTFTDLFSQFRMPLFFFVSGFVLYKASRVWNGKEILSFFKKKLPVQLIFPAVCLFVFLWLSHRTSSTAIKYAVFDMGKAGYWFTFVLLEFYVIYVLLQQLPLKGKWRDIVQLFVAVGIALLVYFMQECRVVSVKTPWWSLLSIPHWYDFLFFFLGTLARKHFPKFEKLMDTDVVIVLCLLTYIGVNLMGYTIVPLHLLGIPGVILVFAFFRRHQDSFTKERRLGRVMQYVGRHTLDIYLLHYIVLLSFDLSPLRRYFVNAPLVQLVCGLVASVIVISMCLIVSNVLRLSPFIAHYCFGAKR